MKKFALALVASTLLAAPALADNVSIDSDDNKVLEPYHGQMVKAEASGLFGSTFGGFKSTRNNDVSTNAIDSDDNQIYNLR